MAEVDFQALDEYAKHFAGLDEAKIKMLHTIADDIVPHLAEVTDNFYTHLNEIDKAKPFLEGREEALRNTHLEWLNSIFSGSFDLEYTKYMYKVGDVHVKIKLPVEFMAGGMGIIKAGLIKQTLKLYIDDPDKLSDALLAINAGINFSLLVMQESYQSSSLAAELEKFLLITGMSRKLFDNLSLAYAD